MREKVSFIYRRGRGAAPCAAITHPLSPCFHVCLAFELGSGRFFHDRGSTPSITVAIHHHIPPFHDISSKGGIFTICLGHSAADDGRPFVAAADRFGRVSGALRWYGLRGCRGLDTV